MKKIVLVVALVAFLGAGTAFAGEYPNGFGIGVFGQYGFGDIGGTGGGLSIKIPGVPVFWGLNVALGESASGNTTYFGLGLTGDFHIFDNSLGSNLNWWLGVGGLFRMDLYSEKVTWQNDPIDYNWINIGVRVPVGINLTFSMFDLYFQAVPSAGVRLYSGWKFEVLGITFKDDSSVNFGWGVPLEVGIRIWL